ncbi:solute carrier organic anion transporter family member 3a1 [Limosa lapponica baueri]|uniref:Solute carrier organic anion transporter family member 3a1 n=1 Tax=Limosa lapponica baueri TaxID=1758121 RepID=A0A2I0TMM6_LIMLA|nr:solute carrier organic anion transporter family member 3a1 [Limosa lapponica baueri]
MMNVSVLTTLERRFNLQSADVGVIASSFEIGNLALILFVSYFGARGHRPRLIGCGGIVMALGALLSALPEFLTHQYEYESGEIRWGAEGRDVCAANGSTSDEGPDPDLICRNRTATNMMYLLLIGAQVLLGIGATPVQPLGVSYIDDHVRRKDSSLYIGFYLPFSICILVYHKVVPAVTLGVKGELNRMAFSVHICPDGTNPVRGKELCVVTADSDLCSSVG